MDHTTEKQPDAASAGAEEASENYTIDCRNDTAAGRMAVDSTGKDLEAEPPATPGDEPSTKSTEDSTPAPPPYSVFSQKTKVFLVMMTVFATLFSPFSSFMYLPAITPIAAEYHQSIASVNLSVTLYQVLQAVGPLVFGDLSDIIGRRPVYVITFTLYIAANIGLALQHSFGALLVLRALQSAGSSATVAIGNAVMADFTTRAERGGYIAGVQSSIMFAPALAPVLGGILSQFLGWRSTFWFLIIASGVFLLLYIPLMPETARNLVGNGSIPPPNGNLSLLAWIRRRRLQRTDPAAYAAQMQRRTDHWAGRAQKTGWRQIPVPNVWAAVAILFEKDVGLLMLFAGLLVMVNYAMLVPLEDVVRRQYHFNELQVGLCYIPFAAGSVIGGVICGRFLNWNYARIARGIAAAAANDSADGNASGTATAAPAADDSAAGRAFPIERARLQLMWPGITLTVATVVPWGWAVDSGANLAVPLVVLFFAGVGGSAPMAVATTLLVDLYPMNPGRVSSTFNLARAALSAVGTAVVQHIIDAWGYGYTYLFLGLVIAAASPCIVVVQHWGPGWREKRFQRFERAKAKQSSKEAAAGR